MMLHGRKTYKPAELEAVLAVLDEIMCCTPRDPARLVIALHERGYRIVHVEDRK